MALAIGAALTFAAAAFLGALVFLAMLGIVAFGTLALAARLWWLRRKARRAGGAVRRRSTYEGDYVVVDPNASDRDR